MTRHQAATIQPLPSLTAIDKMLQKTIGVVATAIENTERRLSITPAIPPLKPAGDFSGVTANPPDFSSILMSSFAELPCAQVVLDVNDTPEVAKSPPHSVARKVLKPCPRSEFNLSVRQDVHGTWRSSVVLPCSYSPVHYTPHSVIWLMNGLMILTRDNTRDHRGRLNLPWESEGGDVSLTIRSLQIDDGGQYSCEVSLMLNGTNDLLKKEALFNLDVTKVAVTTPLIQPEGSFLEVSEGATVNLTCSAEGSPPITYRWYKRDLAPGSCRVFQSGGVSLLIINFQTSHSGTYYCEAENQIPAKTRQQSDEVHLCVTEDTIAKVNTPTSGMGSTEGTIPPERSGSTHSTEAPSSANAAGAASQTPPSARIPKTVIYNTESPGNKRRLHNQDARKRHTPVNNMIATPSTGEHVEGSGLVKE
ncbi:uncharacterized protein LOC144751948 [Lissotriton helveticus]